MRRDAFPGVPPCPHALPLPDAWGAHTVPCACPDEEPFHLPGCPWHDAACDPADYGPTEVEDTEYDWLVPGGPEDPDRPWAYRDSGE
jgi:hypothetical protein